MHNLILIAIAGKDKAVDRLIDRLDTLVFEETQRGGIDGVTTEIIRGATADTAREKLRELKAGKQ